jgi:hypothetical protein
MPLVPIAMALLFFLSAARSPAERRELAGRLASLIPFAGRNVERGFRTPTAVIDAFDTAELREAAYAEDFLLVASDPAGNRYIAIFPFTAEAGFRLDRRSSLKVDAKGRAAVLSLPAPELLLATEEGSRVESAIHDGITGLDRDLYLKPFLAAFEAKVAMDAVADGILEDASSRAEAYFTGLYGGEFPSFRVDIKPPKPDFRSVDLAPLSASLRLSFDALFERPAGFDTSIATVSWNPAGPGPAGLGPAGVRVGSAGSFRGTTRDFFDVLASRAAKSGDRNKPSLACLVFSSRDEGGRAFFIAPRSRTGEAAGSGNEDSPLALYGYRLAAGRILAVEYDAPSDEVFPAGAGFAVRIALSLEPKEGTGDEASRYDRYLGLVAEARERASRGLFRFADEAGALAALSGRVPSPGSLGAPEDWLAAADSLSVPGIPRVRSDGVASGAAGPVGSADPVNPVPAGTGEPREILDAASDPSSRFAVLLDSSRALDSNDEAALWSLGPSLERILCESAANDYLAFRLIRSGRTMDPLERRRISDRLAGLPTSYRELWDGADISYCRRIVAAKIARYDRSFSTSGPDDRLRKLIGGGYLAASETGGAFSDEPMIFLDPSIVPLLRSGRGLGYSDLERLYAEGLPDTVAVVAFNRADVTILGLDLYQNDDVLVLRRSGIALFKGYRPGVRKPGSLKPQAEMPYASLKGAAILKIGGLRFQNRGLSAVLLDIARERDPAMGCDARFRKSLENSIRRLILDRLSVPGTDPLREHPD